MICHLAARLESTKREPNKEVATKDTPHQLIEWTRRAGEVLPVIPLVDDLVEGGRIRAVESVEVLRVEGREGRPTVPTSRSLSRM